MNTQIPLHVNHNGGSKRFPGVLSPTSEPSMSSSPRDTNMHGTSLHPLAQSQTGDGDIHTGPQLFPFSPDQISNYRPLTHHGEASASLPPQWGLAESSPVRQVPMHHSQPTHSLQTVYTAQTQYASQTPHAAHLISASHLKSYPSTTVTQVSHKSQKSQSYVLPRANHFEQSTASAPLPLPQSHSHLGLTANQSGHTRPLRRSRRTVPPQDHHRPDRGANYPY